MYMLYACWYGSQEHEEREEKRWGGGGGEEALLPPLSTVEHFASPSLSDLSDNKDTVSILYLIPREEAKGYAKEKRRQK